MLIAGCSFQHGNPPSGTGDGSIDAVDGEVRCSYSSLFDTCTTMMGTTGLTLTPGDWTYNTDTHVLTFEGNEMPTPPSMVIDAAAGPIDILFVSSFTLQAGATLRPTSPNLHRAFGVASTGPIEIIGIINGADAGAGARVDADCGASTGKPGDDLATGGGGGGGGAFAGKGGDGSKGNADGTNSNGGAGGTAIAARPMSPIGGCDGGPGGDGSGSGGEGGDGGGAVYLASATSISISGVIDVGGGFGARGGNNADAGGGGGAGGMILIESKLVLVSGVMVANGGGGGEGNTNGVDGESGRRDALRAKGGSLGDANGGDGADGGARGNLDGASTTDLQNGGGGGGGGGAGFVAIACSAPMVAGSAITSPQFAAWP
jgi:hypothetical protein